MLQKQVVTIPIAEGLDTKTDPALTTAGKALTLENARFVKTGRLSKRYGGVALTTNSDDSGLATADISAIVSDNEGINLLTDAGVYSYSDGQDEWKNISSLKDFIKVRTDYVGKSSCNHYMPQIAYNSAFNLVAYCYREVQELSGLTTTYDEFLTVVLEDLTTGLKKVKRFDIAVTQNIYKNLQKIAIVDDGGTPKIMVFAWGVTGSYTFDVAILDANLATLSAFASTFTGTLTEYTRMNFDIVSNGTTVVAAIMYETTLRLYKYTGASTTSTSSANLTVTNRLAYSSAGSGQGAGMSAYLASDTIHIAWIYNNAAVYGSAVIFAGYSFSGLANTIVELSESVVNSVDVAIMVDGTEVVAAVTMGNTSDKMCTLIADFSSGAYIVGGISPTLADVVLRLATISRPFIKNGGRYVVCKSTDSDQITGVVVCMDTFRIETVFSYLQMTADRKHGTTYYGGNCDVIEVDGELITVYERKYGSSTSSALEFVATNGTSRVILDFETDYTSGTRAKIGETNYYTNGRTVAFDGRGAYEAGFDMFPKITSVAENTSSGANANVTSKTISYIAVYNYYNGKGELERSAPSAASSITTTANASYVQINVAPYPGSYKDDGPRNLLSESSYECDIVVYRAVSGTYYRCGNTRNKYFATREVIDGASDASLQDNEILYTTGDVLQIDNTPNAKFSVAGGSRLFLGGIEEDEVAFSHKQLFGECIGFSAENRIRVSTGTQADKTPISALGYLDSKLIIFRNNSVYFVSGNGPNELGLGGFTDAEIISSDVGCLEPRSVLNIPSGLIFKSKKGIYLLGRDLSVSYVGAPVEDFNAYNVIAALVSEKNNEARFYLSSGSCLVYNFIYDAWSVFTGQTTVDASIHDSSPISISSNVLYKETVDDFTDSGSAYYAQKIKTPWLKISGLQDFGRVWSATVLGKYKSAHTLRVKAYYDYATDYSETYDFAPSASDSQYQYRCHLQKQKCEAVQFEIYDLAQAGTGESMELTALTLEVGLKRGSMKLAAGRKA